MDILKRGESNTEITYISRWVKNGIRLAVVSNGKEGQKVKKFTFHGPASPFPCFSMESTFDVISAWLRNNGWDQLHGFEKHVVTRRVDYDGEESRETVIIKHIL